jgi:glycosyltransferase involved in cell wall biosynthesis
VVTLVDLLSSSGGAEHLALVIATHLDPERFESTLCVSRWPPPKQYTKDKTAPEALQRLREAGVGFLPLERKRKVELAPWLRLGRFLRRERIDVLHAHKFGSNVPGSAVARLAGVPVVLAHEHTWSYEGQPLRRLLDREVVARAADRFIAVSREDQRRMVEVEHVKPQRTMFIPLGLDVLLRAAAGLLSQWPDLQVLLIGDGPERQALERLSGELGLEANARFLGLRQDVPEVLRALDVAVCSSDFEGSPLAILEYMDAALPVVSTRVGGVPDMIEPGVHGLLVAPKDPDALGAAIAELLRDPQRRREMGLRARERRRSEFELSSMLERLEALYLELLEQRRPRRTTA